MTGNRVIYDIDKRLNNNALFKLSLGSKELFHSNFIESVLSIENLGSSSFTKLFFENFLNTPLGDDLFLESFREQNHTDIKFKFYKSSEKREADVLFTIIIENKVKSLPDQDQLNDYYNNYKSPSKDKDKFILLSLIAPVDFKERDVIPWTFKTYNDLAIAFSNVLDDFKGSLPVLSERITFKDLINEYVDFIDILSELRGYIHINKNDPYIFFNGLINDIDFRELRIHDLVLKLKFQEIKKLLSGTLSTDQLNGFTISNELKKKDTPKPGTIYLNTDFTNSKCLVDAAICIGKIKDKGSDINLYHCLTVQLQGDQLRYCSYLHNVVIKKANKLPVRVVKKIHKTIIPLLKEAWFDNIVLKEFFEKRGLGYERKGNGRKEDKNEDVPGYCKFDDEFYFRYDTIVKYRIEDNLKILEKGNEQTTIEEILDYLKKLLIYVIINKTIIIENITKGMSDYSYHEL